MNIFKITMIKWQCERGRLWSRDELLTKSTAFLGLQSFKESLRSLFICGGSAPPSLISAHYETAGCKRLNRGRRWRRPKTDQKTGVEIGNLLAGYKLGSKRFGAGCENKNHFVNIQLKTDNIFKEKTNMLPLQMFRHKNDIWMMCETMCFCFKMKKIYILRFVMFKNSP